MARPTKDQASERQSRAASVLQALTDKHRARQEPDYDLLIGDTADHMTVGDALHGVSVSWLSQVFNMDPGTIKKRLKDCPPLQRRKAGFVYDLKVAAPYLVTPKIDIDAYIRTMKSTDLPAHLNDSYWSAMRKRQQWEQEAGDLWSTNAVVEVLGDTFMSIKFAIQLWADEIEQEYGLTAEQREKIVKLGDSLQQEIHAQLVSNAKLKRSTSQLHSADVAKGSNFADMDAEPEIISDDGMNLI